jgi:hypothetical protein
MVFFLMLLFVPDIMTRSECKRFVILSCLRLSVDCGVLSCKISMIDKLQNGRKREVIFINKLGCAELDSNLYD